MTDGDLPEGKSRIDRLRESVARSPDSPVAHMKLGMACLRLGDLRQAEEELRRAVDLDPGYDEAWVNLGGILLSRWDFAGCVELNRQVAARSPDLVEAHYNQGLGHLYLNQPEEMVSCFRRVVELKPDHPGGQYHLAVGLLAVGEAGQARAALDRAVALGYSPQPEFLRELERKGGGPERRHQGGGSEPRHQGGGPEPRRQVNTGSE